MSTRKKVLGAIAMLTVFGIVGVAYAATALALLPNGVGNYNQFTTSGVATHYQNVDEASCNGLTDYNQTSTVGNRDSYTVDLSSVPNGAVITSIALKPCASRVSGGGTNPVANVFYRWNGVDSADRGSYSLSATTPVDLATSSYTVALTKSTSSSLEVGAVLTSGTKGVRLSRIGAVVTYETLPADPSSLSASAATSTVILSWTDNSSNESSFKIERGTDGVNFTQIASTTANIVSFADGPLGTGNYFYRVRAANAAGNSGYTNVASSTIP